MLEVQYGNLKIRVQEEPDYDINSADNKPYDKVIQMADADFAKSFSLTIQDGMELTTIMLIAPYYTPAYTIIADHPDGLLLMLNTIICIFDPIKCEIIRRLDIDPIGTMFEVHRYKEDYILYGEFEIYRVTSELEILWTFSARDIWVRCGSDEPAFVMKEDRICLYDFEDNYYEIDYEGKLLK